MEKGPVAVKLLVILGPTASGKTGLAVRIAEEVGGEIINADSMQVYRRMDIGAAKPSPDQLRRVRHHLLDLVEPDHPFSVADFRREAETAIADISTRGKRVIVCGGTGLYIKALTRGLMDAPGGDEALRSELKGLAEREGVGELHRRLALVDPVAAIRLHPNDRVRIVRALEVHHLTGRPISEHIGEHRFEGGSHGCLKIGLKVDRDALYRTIDNRVERMIGNGLVDEVRALLADGYSSGLKPMRSIGYRQVCGCLAGEYSLEEAVRLIKRDTRRYAKRQLTWFNRDPEIKWIEYPENVAMIVQNVNDFFD